MQQLILVLMMSLVLTGCGRSALELIDAAGDGSSQAGTTSATCKEGRATLSNCLDLEKKSLTSLPAEIGQLTKLEKLWLFDNELTSLPPEIGQLTNLTRLNLYDNPLTTLPPEIERLPKLKELLASGDLLDAASRALLQRLKARGVEVYTEVPGL